MFYPFILTLFFFCFLILQILILEKINFDIDFLKRGEKISTGLSVIIVLLCAILALGLSILYLKASSMDRFLYFFSFLFLSNTFITIFLLLKTENVFRKFIFSALISSILLSITLFYQQSVLKNIITAGCLLWISPLFFKHFNIKRSYIFTFLIFFMLFDIYNVYIVNPVILSSYNDNFFNGFVQFGRLALGMGDFMLGYLTLGLMWRDKGIKDSLVLAAVISIILLGINLIGFKHDIPFSIFIVIPTLLIYFKKSIIQS